MPYSPLRRRRTSPKLTAAVEPVRRETVTELVARRIEALIRGGALHSGDRLPPEPELARRLQVSRSSRREALKGLLFLGLLRSRPGAGTYIQPSLTRVLGRPFQWMVLLKQVQYLEIYELRRIIEPAAAALAARRAKPEDIDRMECALAAMRLAVDAPEEFHKHDIEFHSAFAQASNNVALQATMRVLYDAMAEARKRVLPLIGDMSSHWKRHERMFLYIRDGKPVLARRAVLDDLLYAEQLLRHDMEKRGHEDPQVSKQPPVRKRPAPKTLAAPTRG